MKHLIFIALGGAGGALARHWMSTLVHNTVGTYFPWGTLAVNVLGSFCIGIVYVLVVERGLVHADWRSVVMVGFLGAFTTFSTFSLETVSLLENGQSAMALAYMIGSVSVCVFVAWMAIGMSRLF